MQVVLGSVLKDMAATVTSFRSNFDLKQCQDYP